MYRPGQSQRRTVRRFVLAAALALVGSVLLAGPASAHASLISTDPTEGQVLASAPATATFTFDEPVRSTSGGVHLFNAAGKELEADAKTRDAALQVDLPGGLPDGTYVIAWRVVSADGHPVAGALTFSIGTPSATVAARASAPQSSPTSIKAALALAQAWTYLGVLGAGGLVAFGLLLLPREKGIDQIRARLHGLAKGFAWVSVVAGAVTVVLTAMYQRGEDFSALFSDTPVEIPTGSELLSWALASAGVWIAVLGARRAEVHRTAGPIALAGVVIALGALGLVGHTRAFPPLWLMLATDLTHLAAGTVWFGGLIGLVISLRRLAERPRLAALVLGRFSVLAGWLLVGVAISGTILGWRILRTWSALVETDFGRVLLVKIAVVLAVALLAGWNRYRLMPAVLADSGFADRGAASTRMQRVVRIEAVLLVGVLGLTGFLVDRSPAPDMGAIALPGGFDSSTFTGQLDAVRVVASVEPAGVGKNVVTLQLQDTAGNPLEPAGLPGLRVAEGELSLGDQAVTNIDSGTYRASVLIPRAGTWTLQVSVPLSEVENPVVSVKVPVLSQ